MPHERTPLLSAQQRGDGDDDDATTHHDGNNNSGSSSSSSTKAISDTDSTPSSWLTLPHKPQLALLALCRFGTAMSQTSVLPYLYYFLRSLETGQTPGDLARRAGYLASAFASCMFLTGWIWGRVADSVGRKKVVMSGLAATAASCLVFGFSESFGGLVAARCVAGLMDGNIAVLRTMITETVEEKKHHSRAFLIPPLSFNLGAVIGPLLGGLLADPTSKGSPASRLFGPGTFFGGSDGVAWMRRWKYALPNVVSAVMLVTVVVVCFFFLEETLEAPDQNIKVLPSAIKKLPHLLPHRSESVPSSPPPPTTSLTKIWTRNVVLTVLSSALLPLHMSSFLPLLSIFLSTPRAAPAALHPPLYISGGLGLPPPTVGTMLSLFGGLGIAVQVLAYPALAAYLGILPIYRVSLSAFPLAYCLVPFLVLLPTKGVVMWSGIGVVMLLMVGARTALPSSVILVTRVAPKKSVLGRIHGVAMSLGGLAKAVGPTAAGADRKSVV